MNPVRALLSSCVLARALLSAGGTAQPAADQFRVTLWGTGSPVPVMHRFGPGVMVQAGGQNLLINAGRDGTQRLLQVGLKLGAIDALFLTQLHSNHVVGIPDPWLSGWLEPSWAQREGPFRVFGRAGSQNLTDGLAKAYNWDIKARIDDQKLDPANIRSEVTQIKQGTIYEKGGVKITAFDVDYGELLKPSLRLSHRVW